MPAEPREFRILQNLQAALLAISVAGGYHHTVAASAVKLDPDVDVESLIGATPLLPFLILDVAPDVFSYSPQMANISLPVTVHFVNDSDVTNDLSWIREHLRLCADIEQAICQDISRGGLAIDTRIVSREAHTGEGSRVWTMVKLDIGVRRTYGAPNA